MKNQKTMYAHLYLPHAVGMWHESIQLAQLAAGAENNNLFLRAQWLDDQVVAVDVVDEADVLCKRVEFLGRVYWVPNTVKYIHLDNQQVFASEVFGHPHTHLGPGPANTSAWVEC